MAKTSIPRENIEISVGDYYPDGWMSRSLSGTISGLSIGDTLEVEIYNPDYNMRYLENEVRLNVGTEIENRVMRARSIFRVSTPIEDEVVDFEVSSSAFLIPDLLDMRERSLILKFFVSN